VRKFCEAREKKVKSVPIWGTGVATRDFLHVADAAEGIVSAMELYDGIEPCNLGSSREVAIKVKRRNTQTSTSKSDRQIYIKH
jgi:GDP-L-fucose synthase